MSHAGRQQPNVVLMPLSVFDKAGGRIGYGAGYYDRAVARLVSSGRQPILAGLAFDEQEADSVPQEAHDVALHMIITPTRTIEVIH